MKGYITIEELKKQRFVTQREGCDADVNHVMNEVWTCQVEAEATLQMICPLVSLVMGGFGVCLMPELVIRNIPFPVDVIPLEVEEKRTIVLAYVRGLMYLAPAVQKMQSYILEQLSEESRGGAIDYEIQVSYFLIWMELCGIPEKALPKECSTHFPKWG